MAESSTNGKGRDHNGGSGSQLPGITAPETVEAGPPRERDDEDEDVLVRGSTVGRYLVLERLGAGAMGVVYAAYDPELDRKVAIKILRPHHGKGDPAKRQARLVREAQAMAKLSHANVGAIHDVGVHQGQVFMALEYLSGGTLKNWLAAEKRPWREIVRMFIEVGNGLAAAHAEGLIHRDFKPDNVLLDKAGKPKVVDFGLVRLSSSAVETSAIGSNDDFELEMSLAETQIPSARRIGAAALTRTGALAGTPAYMAAEQFLGKAVDARTDQFAFCVALYEALYAERPFPGDTVIGIADAVTSGRIKGAPKDAPVPAWIRRSLVRGLSVEPSRRFATVEALTAALANDPAKRTRKWVLAGTTVAVMTSLVAVATWSGSKPRTLCTGAAQRLAGVWEPGGAVSKRKTDIREAFASTGKSYAGQAYASAARLFDQYADRWTGMYSDACEATHVRGEQSEQVLDLRMTCLNERLGNARALSDVFASADGKVVENAVSAAAALPSLDRCADIPALRAVIRPPEDPATRRRVDALRTELARLIALRDSGQCARAIPKADALIADVRAAGYEPLLAETLYESAHVGNNCGDAAEALQRFKDAHAAATASHDDEIAAKSSALIPSFAINRLAQITVAREWVIVARGDVARLRHETLADAILAQAEGMLAATDGAYPRALTAADRSIEITRRLLGPDDPLTVQWEANKGNWQEAAGQLEQALETDVRVREQFERLLGRDHPRLALIHSNEGEVLNLLGRYAEAGAAYRRAVELFRQSGADPTYLAWALTGLGRAELGLGRPSVAVAVLEEALAIRIRRQASPSQLGETRFVLARALWSRPVERRRALALGVSARRSYGDDQKAAAEIDAWLAQVRGSRVSSTRKENSDG